MKTLAKLRKKFVINTVFIEKNNFNEPVYLIDANKEFVKVFTTDKKGKALISEIKINEKLTTKTFITVEEFFKKCKKDNAEFKIEKVENGDIYIRVCYLDDLSLFYKLSFKNSKQTFILTNINNYKFYKTNKNMQQTFNKTSMNYLEKEKLISYLSNVKNIKRDYLFTLKKQKEILEKEIINSNT